MYVVIVLLALFTQACSPATERRDLGAGEADVSDTSAVGDLAAVNDTVIGSVLDTAWAGDAPAISDMLAPTDTLVADSHAGDTLSAGNGGDTTSVDTWQAPEPPYTFAGGCVTLLPHETTACASAVCLPDQACMGEGRCHQVTPYPLSIPGYTFSGNLTETAIVDNDTWVTNVRADRLADGTRVQLLAVFESTSGVATASLELGLEDSSYDETNTHVVTHLDEGRVIAAWFKGFFNKKYTGQVWVRSVQVNPGATLDAKAATKISPVTWGFDSTDGCGFLGPCLSVTPRPDLDGALVSWSVLLPGPLTNVHKSHVIRGRIVDTYGQPIGPGFQVNAKPAYAGSVNSATVKDGMWVVWTEIPNGALWGMNASHARKYNAFGKPLTAPLIIGPLKPKLTKLALLEGQPVVFSFADGSLAVSRSSGGKSGPRSFMQQLLPPSGVWTPQLADKTLGMSTTGLQIYATTRQFQRRGVTAWADSNANYAGVKAGGVFLRRYFREVDALDCAVTQVDAKLPPSKVFDHRDAMVRSFPDGRLLVTWVNALPNGKGAAMMARVLPQ